MGITNQEVLDSIAKMHRDQPMYGHPLWTGMVEGRWDLEQTRYLCKQHGGIPLHNHNYHGNLYTICPDPEWREMIAEVAYEEATGRLFSDGVSHHKLYLNFAKGLGLKPEEMYDPPYCPGVIAFQAYFTNICRKTFLEGVAAHMLAGEAAIPGLYIQIAHKLQEKFGLDDEAVAYWVIHDSADEEHSDVGKKLLDQYATTDKERQLVIKTAKQMLDVQHLMYDDMLKYTLLLQTSETNAA
ncbi:MAG: iron-containing redox enzyme family protein [Rhodospirillaceae bacterium]|jgi:pyrroloquinoline quinone (PQQ) biosynthesis protein C